MKNIKKSVLTLALSTTVYGGMVDELYNNVQLYANDMILMKDIDKEKISIQDEDKKFIEKKWEDLFKQIEDAEKISDKIETAPKSAWFSSDKGSLRDDLDDELSDILFLITEDKFAIKYVKIIRKLKDKIKEEEYNITLYKESSLLSSDEVSETKFKSKIDIATKNIKHYNNNIDKIKDALLFNLNSAGIDFTQDQLTVLLSRVDIDNIIQLTLVYNNLKSITEKLGLLMDATKDNIKATKKYYAMFVILSELIVYIQKQYIYKMDNVYLPKIDTIIFEAQKIQIKTKKLISTTKDDNMNSILKNNLKYQKMSLDTAILYKQNLIDQREQIKTALKKSELDLKVALNTFKTVQISFTLLNLIKESSKSFNSLMNIQLPKIIPFENIEIQKEYNKITDKLSQ